MFVEMTQTMVKSNHVLVCLSWFEADKKYAKLFLTLMGELTGNFWYWKQKFYKIQELMSSLLFNCKMKLRTALSCSLMILQKCEVLEATQIQFLILFLLSIFLATATQILNKVVKSSQNVTNHCWLSSQLLTIFINHLLFTLYHKSLLTKILTFDCWGLKDNKDDFMNLNSWDLQQTNLNVYKVITLSIMSDSTTLTPIYSQW